MKKDFLLEIGTEEIPAGYLQPASVQLRNLLCELLKKSEIAYKDEDTRIFYTPRRIAVLITEIESRQKDKTIEVTGPPKEMAFDEKGNLTPAGIGFAKAQGVAIDKLVIKKKGKKEVISCEKVEKGKETKEILRIALPDIIPRISFPKSMRWLVPISQSEEETQFRFARPIRWLVALFDDEIIDFEIAGVKSGRETRGLRWVGAIHELPLQIQNPNFYEETLKNNNIIPDAREKRKVIIESIRTLVGTDYNLSLLPDDKLLEEVANLIECPKAILCKFDEKYLKLPREVVITAMETHQRYFALTQKDSTLAPYFIVIANTIDGNLDKIREGNERVLRGRLDDAEFYFNEDKKIPLESRIDELKEVVWQEGLGTLYDKTQRLIELSKYIASNFIILKNSQILEKSAKFFYVDLVTNMIKDGKEFTQLEGVYGYILGKEQDLDKEIIEVLKARVYPSAYNSRLEGVVLAIANIIDTIAGAFILNKIPTGSKDPLGIKRAGNSLVDIIIIRKLHVLLKNLVSKTIELYRMQNIECRCQEEIIKFLIQRFRSYLEDIYKNIRYDILNAVLSTPNDDLVDLYKRAETLNLLRDKEEFITLVRLAKRIRNILKSSELSARGGSACGGRVKSSELKVELLKETEEKELYKILNEKKSEFENYIKQKDYSNALNILISLAPATNNFFDKVLVMAEEQELRENRLALLGELNSLFQQIADFSLIQGTGVASQIAE